MNRGNIKKCIIKYSASIRLEVDFIDIIDYESDKHLRLVDPLS